MHSYGIRNTYLWMHPDPHLVHTFNASSSLQEERLSGLQSHLEEAASQWASAAAEASTASSALLAERARAEALQRQLGAVAAERKELAARLAAAQIEAAGNVQVWPSFPLVSGISLSAGTVQMGPSFPLECGGSLGASYVQVEPPPPSG